MPNENEPDVPYRFSRQRRRLSEGDCIESDYDVSEGAKDEEDEEAEGEFSNLDAKMQGIQQAVVQRNVF